MDVPAKVANLRPSLLMLCPCDSATMAKLADRFTLHCVDGPAERVAAISNHGTSITGLVTRGDIGANRSLIEALPHLEIIACYGVGTDAIDFAAARDRQVQVTNTPDVLTADVADLGIGLALAVMRQIPAAHAFVQAGLWAGNTLQLVRRFHGCRLGILGYGRVGKAVAHRGRGFDTRIGYFDIREDGGSVDQFFDDPVNLARWADVLIITLAGGPATQHLVGKAVLQALGPTGFLVNVSRGAVVNEPDLLDALEAGDIAGAALDVFWNEPNIDPRFLSISNVVLQPHHASATQETRRAMGELVYQNLVSHFTGGPLLSPV